jgi:hypothetical protein
MLNFSIIDMATNIKNNTTDKRIALTSRELAETYSLKTLYDYLTAQGVEGAGFYIEDAGDRTRQIINKESVFETLNETDMIMFVINHIL